MDLSDGELRTLIIGAWECTPLKVAFTSESVAGFDRNALPAPQRVSCLLPAMAAGITRKPWAMADLLAAAMAA